MLKQLQQQVKKEVLEASLMLSDMTAMETASAIFENMTPDEQADFMRFALLTPDEKREIVKQEYLAMISQVETETTKLLKYISKHHVTEYAQMMQTAPQEADWLEWQNWTYGEYIRILEKR